MNWRGLTVRKIIYFFLLISLLLMTGCDSEVTEDYLIGGVWEEKVEYKDGEPMDEITCIGYFTKGLEFREDGIVYNEERNEDFEYELTEWDGRPGIALDRKSTRLNSSHVAISYAVFCLKKKKI